METVQYTIRNIPKPVDQVIRKRAKASGKSFNQTVVDLLSLQTFGTTKAVDGGFEWLHGAGKDLIGPEFDEAIADISKPDPNLWK
jgi:hypothetical protein